MILCHYGLVARGHRVGPAVAAAVIVAAVVIAAAASLWPASLAGAASSSPPLPIGSRPALERPAVYPGGGLDAFGDALTKDPALSASATTTPALNSPVVAMVLTTGGDGYWLAGADGGVYAHGAAEMFGSAGGITLQGPVVTMAATPDDGGYWLGGIDGGVFAFGDAQFYGSMGGSHLNQPIVGMAATPDGKGYWEVASDGGIFAFGDAQFYGSMGGTPLNAPVLSMAATPDGKGYWMVGVDGGVFTFGDATFEGSAATGPAVTPVTQLVPTPDGQGYWLLEPDGFDYSFANPPPDGSFPGSSAIVSAAESQVQPDPTSGYFCNPYGPCEEWCALFATWAWQQGGAPIPSYAFTGDVYDWAAANGTVLPPTATPVPGDAVLYGTGPSSTATSVHMGIVAQVWPDGAIVTIEGDAGPGSTGYLAVVLNGPFLPWDSPWYNGVPIYAFAQP